MQLKLHIASPDESGTERVGVPVAQSAFERWWRIR
jgi:hypothetical protein